MLLVQAVFPVLISWPPQIGPNESRAPKILREGIVPSREVISAWKNLI